MSELRNPAPPFDKISAREKVQRAEDAWNTCNPTQVASAYTEDCQWRNRGQEINGRSAIVTFLTNKWNHEHGYRLRKNLWVFSNNNIAVRFQYEWFDDNGQWWRSYGNELWEFNKYGYMTRREASINDVAITPDQLRVTPGTGILPVW